VAFFIFGKEVMRMDKGISEKVEHISVKRIHPFSEHPFEVRDDDSMKETVQSVKEYGVIMPVIVRPSDEGGYEMISGHRRMRACELAGMDTIPAIVRDIDRDTAIIMMVDSNLQRENILPSEKAKAYKMKLEAIKRQGARNDLTSRQLVDKLKSAEFISQAESGRQVQRYIRLTHLIPELSDMVD
jgi:ParB family chromosome partitioning protein